MDALVLAGSSRRSGRTECGQEIEDIPEEAAAVLVIVAALRLPSRGAGGRPR